MMDKRIALGVSAVLVLLVILKLYNLIVAFIPAKVSFVSSRDDILLQKPVDIANIHLFGKYQDEFLPRTSLELNLFGVFVADDKSQALIGVPGATAKLYSVGETVAGGAILHEILVNRVILKHNGKLETLLLIRPQLKFGPKPEDNL